MSSTNCVKPKTDTCFNLYLKGKETTASAQYNTYTTGLPDKLKAALETLSGYRMDDVRVHYNSGKPAQLQALAYAQGTDIYMGPAQEKYLPHEAWHVVQQKQGRVQPTTKLKGDIYVNEDKWLELEADVMAIKIVKAAANQNKEWEDEADDMIAKTGNRNDNSHSAGIVLQKDLIADQIIQRVSFRVGQDWEVISWLMTANLLNFHPFTGLHQYYWNNGSLANNDPDAISMLFLIMVPSYKYFAMKNIAINYLYGGLGGGVVPPATVTEFTNKYKIFYHLYNRAVHARSQAPIYDTHTGLVNLSGHLGNQAQGPTPLTGGPAAANDEQIARIYTAAAAGTLRFHSQINAVTHLVKHGAMYNKYTKITGMENQQDLGRMIDQYIQDANYAISSGREQATQRDVTLGRNVYIFTTEFETARVSCAPDGSDAFILTYFWHEPPAYVNDLTSLSSGNPNVI